MGAVLIICYHAVSANWPAALAVLPGSIEAQLSVLIRHGYRGATFTQAVTDPPHPRTLAVTFDDAYRSTLELGLPVLDSLGLPGTVFAAADYVDEGRPADWRGMERWIGTEHEHELRTMTVPELSSLRERGWEIGSHTCSHPRLPTLDDARLREEMRRSKSALEERLGAPCTSLAYPYGDVDDRVQAAVREGGYTAAAALSGGFRRPDRLRWPRVASYHSDSLRRFKLKTSPTARRLHLAEMRTVLRPVVGVHD